MPNHKEKENDWRNAKTYTETADPETGITKWVEDKGSC